MGEDGCAQLFRSQVDERAIGGCRMRSEQPLQFKQALGVFTLAGQDFDQLFGGRGQCYPAARFLQQATRAEPGKGFAEFFLAGNVPVDQIERCNDFN